MNVSASHREFLGDLMGTALAAKIAADVGSVDQVLRELDSMAEGAARLRGLIARDVAAGRRSAKGAGRG